MAIEIVDLPIKNGDILIFHSYVNVYQTKTPWRQFQVSIDGLSVAHLHCGGIQLPCSQVTLWMCRLSCLPSGKRLHNELENPPFSEGKSTISITIFNSYVKLPEGNPSIIV